MRQLNNKRILLGVSGGIAAYKSAEIIRRLKEHGAEVRVVMTAAAQEFITPLTLQALSGNPVHTSMLDPEAEAAMGHIELARWADLLLIAPATANLLSRLAAGSGDDLLTTLCLACAAPIVVAPAMNQIMWSDAGTQANQATLQQRQVTVLGPAEGSQACGDIGPGRMLEPDLIASAVADQFNTHSLNGQRIVITSGPTREAIDPVRFISNHSSGKMGFALAQAAVEAGATVQLIAGPVALATPDRCQRSDISSAAEMHQAAMDSLAHCDIFIATAAVADYRPVEVASQKIKKSSDSMSIELTRNPDIIASVANHPQRPFCVGFAAETHGLELHAQTKLANKNLDMIIANDVSDSRIGFNSDNNAVSVFWPGGSEVLPTASKQQLAKSLIEIVAMRWQSNK